MIKKLLCAAGLGLSVLAFSQDYKKKMARAACDCVGSMKMEQKDKKNLTAEFGVCMLKSALPYTKEIKKDYDIDLSVDIADFEKMEQLGMKMGILMAEECQEEFVKISSVIEEEEAAAEPSEMLISGKVSKIEKDQFVVFHVVGDNRMLNKFYWISSVDSNLDLPNEFETLLNKNVNISYFTLEIFDVKTRNYKTLNVISTLKTE